MEKITIIHAQKLLKEDGILLDEKQTKLVLDFLYEMAEIAVDQYLEINESKLTAAKRE